MEGKPLLLLALATVLLAAADQPHNILTTLHRIIVIPPHLYVRPMCASSVLVNKPAVLTHSWFNHYAPDSHPCFVYKTQVAMYE